MILYLRKESCPVSSEIRAAMTDPLWQLVKVVYIEGSPYLETSTGHLSEPSAIISYLQSQISPSFAKQIDTARIAATKALNEIRETGSAMAPLEMVAFRRSVCMQCPFGVKKLFLYKCSQCGCHIKTKTSLITESCPIGKW